MFHALATGGNLERAARSLGVGISTVHRHVGTLEEELGVRLFVRGKRGHQLTEAGHELLARSTEIDAMLSEVRHRIGGRDRELTGSVRVTTTQAAADYILLPRVAELRSRHPRITVELEALPEIVSLVDERPSIALRFQRPERGDVTIRRLADLSCSLFVAPALLATLGDLDLSALRDGNVGYIGWTRQFRDIALSATLSRLFAAPPVITLGSMNGHLEAVRAGLGVAHLPRFVAAHAPELVDLAPESATLSLTAWQVIPRALRHMARVEIAAEFVADAVEALAG